MNTNEDKGKVFLRVAGDTIGGVVACHYWRRRFETDFPDGILFDMRSNAYMHRLFEWGGGDALLWLVQDFIYRLDLEPALAGSDWSELDLRGIRLSTMPLSEMNLVGALYDEGTSFPYNFDPEAAGMRGPGPMPFDQLDEDGQSNAAQSITEWAMEDFAEDLDDIQQWLADEMEPLGMEVTNIAWHEDYGWEAAIDGEIRHARAFLKNVANAPESQKFLTNWAKKQAGEILAKYDGLGLFRSLARYGIAPAIDMKARDSYYGRGIAMDVTSEIEDELFYEIQDDDLRDRRTNEAEAFVEDMDKLLKDIAGEVAGEASARQSYCQSIEYARDAAEANEWLFYPDGRWAS